MAWHNCVVNLNSDSTGSFYTGDIVTGTVVLEYTHRKTIEHIEFLVIGTCKAQWTRPRPTMPHIKFYSEKKKVLFIEIDLFDDIKGKTIKPGVYTYPFHFALPEDLPSTFNSGVAKVNYSIKIKSRGVWGLKKVVPFVVLGTVNLNHIERYLEPSTHEIQKLCWNTDTLIIYVKTFTGFASKQYIPFEIRVINEKKVKIFRICVTLIQKLRYTIQEGHASEEKEICNAYYDHFLNSEEETCNFKIDIPHLTPSSVHLHDPVISISYIFRVAVKFLYHFTAYKDIPVTVASVPVIHYDFN